MTRNQISGFFGQVEELPEAISDESVGRTVEPVTPYLVPPVEQVGQSI